MYQKATQPLSTGKLLDNTMQLYRSSFTKSLPFVIIIALLTSMPNPWMAHSLGADDQLVQDPFALLKGVNIAASFIIVLVNLVLYIAVIHVIAAVMNNSYQNIASSLIIGLRKFIPILIASIVYVIALVSGTLLLIIPGVILSMSLIFFMPLMVVDNQGIIESLTSSHRLVWGEWWRTSTVLTIPVLFYCIFLILMLILSLSLSSVEEVLSGTSLFSATGNILLNILLLPFFLSIVLVQLNDLKLRKCAI